MNVIYELLSQRAKANPEDLALANSRQRLSFLELRQAVDAAAIRLSTLGVSKSQVVAISLPDFENWVVSLALAKLGATGWSLPSEQMASTSNSPMWHHLVTTSVQDVPGNSLLFDQGWFEPTVESEGVEVASYLDGDFVRAIATSGTTGKPKLALFSHQSLVCKTQNLTSVWGGVGREFNFMPLAATGGFSSALTSLITAKPYLARDSRKKPLIDYLVASRVEVLTGSPDQISGFMATNTEHIGLLTGVKSIRLAGSFPGKKFLEKVHSVFQAEITSVYGSTETGAIFSAKIPSGEPFDHLGSLQPGCNARVVNADGLQVPDGTAGMLETRSDAMYSGYLLEIGSLTIEPAPEWFATHDSVKATGDLVEFLGRESNVLNVGGVKFDVSHLEDFVKSLVGVKDALSFSAEGKDSIEMHVMAIVSDTDEVFQLVVSQVKEKFPRISPSVFWRTASVERVGLDKPARWRARQSFEGEYLGRTS